VSAIKDALANATLVLVSLMISYVALEAAYRVYLFESIHGGLTQRFVVLARQNATSALEKFDPAIGYRRAPNTSWENTGGLQNRFRINDHGLIANDIDRSTYGVQKPAGEYRIALLGDSMAAGDANYLRMSDLIQDYLNRSATWRAFVGGKFTRVINFGMNGTGLVQWGAVYEFEAKQFSPDLVIVNFIVHDIMRRFVYRGRGHDIPVSEIRRYIGARVSAAMWNGMPWLELYPDLFAATLGRSLGMQSHLVASAALSGDGQMYFQTQDEAIARSLESLRHIRCFNPRLLLFNQPEYEEFLVPADGPERWPPFVRYLSGKFEAAAAAEGFKVVNLAQIYPSPKDNLQIFGLFNLPIDTHYSDYGTFVYASWLTQYLLDWSSRLAMPPHATPVSCQ